jgi:hypothetical protein
LPGAAATDPQLEAAIAALSEPDRLREAQNLIARAAPALQRVLAAALAEGGWFEGGHRQAVREAVMLEDASGRERAVASLLAEETRLAMLVGAAVGFELRSELDPAGEEGRSSGPAGQAP